MIIKVSRAFPAVTIRFTLTGDPRGLTMHWTHSASHHPRRHLFLRVLPWSFLLLPPGHTCAQTTAPTVPTPAYDVVSIVPNKVGDTSGTGIESHEATFTATNADLTNLLINAFDIKPDLIFGLPPWASSTAGISKRRSSTPTSPPSKNSPAISAVPCSPRS